MAGAIRKATGNSEAYVREPFPWPLVVALQPFVALFREMAEMRYLWSQTISLDGERLKAFLGDSLPATPLDIAVRDTLIGLGCLKGDRSASRAAAQSRRSARSDRRIVSGSGVRRRIGQQADFSAGYVDFRHERARRKRLSVRRDAAQIIMIRIDPLVIEKRLPGFTGLKTYRPGVDDSRPISTLPLFSSTPIAAYPA